MPSQRHVPVYAHRFGGNYGPEGSRSALEKSLACGLEGLECDIIMSADEEVFTLHEPDLALCTDRSGWAEDHHADEIASGQIRDLRGEVSDEQPLRLGEVLEMIPPDLPLQLDIKSYVRQTLAERTARRACDIVRDHRTPDRIEIIAFFTRACEVAVDGGITARLVAWADYAPDAMVQWLLDRGISGMSFEGFILSREIADKLHDAGLSISVGAVNSRNQVERLLPFDPDIVVSDTPAEIRDILIEFDAHANRHSAR
jgi:glycerophosphoryl diester phosphodiesterase